MELLLILLLASVGIFVLYKMMFKNESTSAQIGLATSTAPVVENAPVINKASAAVSDNPLDINQDGKVDIKDAVAVVKKTRARVKKAVDQDGDGKVTIKDAKVIASKAKAKTKEVVVKTRGRKALK